MKGDFRFLKVAPAPRHLGFARVYVDAIPSDNNRVLVDIANVDYNKGEVSPDSHGEWVAASVIGAQDVLEHLAPFLSSQHLITIVKILGTYVDTSEDAVKCASAMAVWEVLFSDRPQPEIVCDDIGHWDLEYPK